MQITTTMQETYPSRDLNEYINGFDCSKFSLRKSVIYIPCRAIRRHKKRIILVDALGMMYFQNMIRLKLRQQCWFRMISTSPIVKFYGNLPI